MKQEEYITQYSKSNLRLFAQNKAIREEPILHVGSLDEQGMLFLLDEVVQLMLEKSEKKQVHLFLEEDGTVEVRIDAPLWPIDLDKPFLDMANWLACPDIEAEDVEEWAVRLTRVNTFCVYFDWSFFDNEVCIRQAYTQGLHFLNSKLDGQDPIYGTAIRLKPDAVLFQQGRFNKALLYNYLQRKAPFYPEYQFILYTHGQVAYKVQAEEGLSRILLAQQFLEHPLCNPIEVEVATTTFTCSLAFNYTVPADTLVAKGLPAQVLSYCNGRRLVEGGSHEEALVQALQTVLKTRYATLVKDASLSESHIEDLTRGLMAVVHIQGNEEAWTFENLGTRLEEPQIAAALATQAAETFTAYLDAHPYFQERLLRLVLSLSDKDWRTIQFFMQQKVAEAKVAEAKTLEQAWEQEVLDKNTKVDADEDGDDDNL